MSARNLLKNIVVYLVPVDFPNKVRLRAMRDKKRIVIQYYSITNARVFATIKGQKCGIFCEIFLNLENFNPLTDFMPEKSLILAKIKCIIIFEKSKERS